MRSCARTAPTASRLDADAQLELPADRSAAAVVDPTVAAALARGEAAPPEWEDELSARLRRQPEVRAALDRMWPVLSGTELVHDLFGFEALIRSASGGVLTDAEQRLAVARARRRRRRRRVDRRRPPAGRRSRFAPRPAERGAAACRVAATVATASSRVHAARSRSSASVASRTRPTCSPATAATRRRVEQVDDEPRTFGHVLVDEAQDLSADAVAHARPSLPVGLDDAGRRLRPGQPPRRAANWDDVISNLPVRVPPHRVTLTVNYRTPAEIMEVANRLLPAAAPGVEPARPVRSTGAHPEVVTVGRAELVASAADAARAVVDPGRHRRGHRAGDAARRDRRRARRPRRGRRRRRGHRRADRGAQRARLQGPRVRPRDRGRAVAPGRARPRPGCASSTWSSPGRRAGSSSCTPSRCRRRLGLAPRSLGA